MISGVKILGSADYSCLDCGSGLGIPVSYCPFCGSKQLKDAVYLATPKLVLSDVPQKLPLEDAAVTDPVVAEPPRPPVSGSPTQVPIEVVAGKAHGHGRWLAILALALVALGAWRHFGGRPESSSPAPKPPAMSSERAQPAPPPIEAAVDVVKTLRVTTTWQTFPLDADPARPFITLSAASPFRLRVDGKLYLVQPGKSVAVDFSAAKALDLKAVDGSVEISLVHAASGSGVTP